MAMAIDWTAMFKDHRGEWVALEDDEKTVIVSGKDPQTVKLKAVEKGFAKPILMLRRAQNS